MIDDVEEALRTRRPEPRADFVRALEADLIAQARRRRVPPVLPVLAAAGALTVTVVLLGIMGALPLRLAGDRPATATQRCSTVVVDRAVRQPRFVVARNGGLKLTYRTEIVRRPVRHCR